jgi:hypothetical protein
MAGKSKIVKGALGALTDIFRKGDDVPVDESRRAFVKGAAASPAVALGGGAAVLGAKALFSAGKFDDIVAKIKSAFDPDAYEDIYSAGETLQKKLGINDSEFAKISDGTTAMDDANYFIEDQSLDINNMNPSDIADMVRNSLDGAFDSLNYDYRKGRGMNPIILIDEFKIPAFKNEVMKKFPNLDPTEVSDLAGKLF